MKVGNNEMKPKEKTLVIVEEQKLLCMENEDKWHSLRVGIERKLNGVGSVQTIVEAIIASY